MCGIPGQKSNYCIFWLHYHIWNAIAQNVSQWWGSYTLHRCRNNWHVYAAHMSPALNRSFCATAFLARTYLFQHKTNGSVLKFSGEKTWIGVGYPPSCMKPYTFPITITTLLLIHRSHLSVSLLTSHGADELLKSFFIFSQLHHQQPHQCSVESCSTAHVHVTVCDTKEGKVLLL